MIVAGNRVLIKALNFDLPDADNSTGSEVCQDMVVILDTGVSTTYCGNQG